MKITPHPELREGEVFITNATDKRMHNPLAPGDRRSSWESVGWKTKRRGKVAYDTDGKAITEDRWSGMFPVFAQRSELEEAGIEFTDS